MLQIEGIDAGYGDVPVLRSVDLTVPEGCIVALLGANGAGKTTLLRVASGLLPASKGQVRVNGTPLTNQSAHHFARAGICHIPEGRGIFRSMTVRENLLLQSPAGGDDSLLDRAIQAFPVLADRMEQTAGTLSGGQQQMLALARAYLTDPGFVLLDEVSMGLAPKIVDEIFEFLGELAKEGTALLLVEQYVVRALRLADFVYILNKGRIEFVGEPGELDEDEVFKTYVGHGM